MKSRYTSLFITIFVMIFMYLPIVMLVSQSFNESRYGGKWLGFSFKWYEALFRDGAVINAAFNTLLVAFVATILSTAIGTCAAWTLNKYRLSKLQSTHYVLIYAPLCVPDVLMGISLLLMFVSLKVDLGLTTVILAHTTFCLSFVTFTVLARLQDFDFNIIQAAQDLGASTTKTLFRVLIPMSIPGISTGITMVFVPAVSTFVISRMLGGGSNLLIGDLIEMQFLGNSYNLNVGSGKNCGLMMIGKL